MRLRAATLATGAVGALTMLLFDGLWARLLGVLLLAAFIVCGVFLVATPEFVAHDGEDGEPPPGGGH